MIKLNVKDMDAKDFKKYVGLWILCIDGKEVDIAEIIDIKEQLIIISPCVLRDGQLFNGNSFLQRKGINYYYCRKKVRESFDIDIAKQTINNAEYFILENEEELKKQLILWELQN